MDRNTALAFALSMLVFVLYLTYQQQRYADAALEAENRAAEIADSRGAEDVGESNSESAPAGGARLSENRDRDLGARDTRSRDSEELLQPIPEVRNIPIQKVILKNANVVAEISNDAGWISSWRLSGYMERLGDREIPIELIEADEAALRTEIGGLAGADFGSLRYEVLDSNDREVLQRAVHPSGVLTRKLRLDEVGYGFDIELSFESRRRDPVDARFELLWPAAVSPRSDFRESSLVAYREEEGVQRTPIASAGKPGFLWGGGKDGVERLEGVSVWAGTDLRYFASVLIDPDDRGGFDVRFETVRDGESAQTRIATTSASIGAGGSTSKKLRGFIGPKSIEQLGAAGPGLEHAINRGYSWLEPLVRLFEIALDKLYALVGNYGLAIIVLTILVRIVTSPLMIKQMKSAEKMREIQPRVKALQEKFKDDRQKQSEEMMKLWKEEGVSPLGGCVPLLFQFPVLIGLFFALQSSIGLRHAPFMLWINDLSAPATLFTVPGFDFPIRILPLIMAGSMFVQQKMTPQTGMDPAQARMMLFMMPAMMLFFSYTFPSGLVLYWTVSNLLGIGHQYWIRSKMQPAG